VSKNVAKKITAVLTLIALITVYFAYFDTSVAEAKVTQAHIERLRQDRQNIKSRMKNVESQINALEFDKMSESVRKNVLEDRIILTGFEIENIVATIEELHILLDDKELQISQLKRNEETYMRQYKERVRSMEEGGMITYLEIIFDSVSFADLLARIEFVSDIMNADKRIYNNLVNARLDTMAAREELLQTMEAMESEYALLENRESELLEQVDELNAIIARLEADLDAANALHRQLSADDARMQQTINSRVAQLRRQQEKAARQAAALSAWGLGSNASVASVASVAGDSVSDPGDSSGSPGSSDPGDSSGAPDSSDSDSENSAPPVDENLKWLAFIIQIEAGNEGMQGRMAVGNVIVNRVRSPLFPGTVKDVILSPGQFPPARSRNIDTFAVSASSIEAARRVLNGEKADGVGNALYFNRKGLDSWASQNRPFIKTIGNHDFYG